MVDIKKSIIFTLNNKNTNIMNIDREKIIEVLKENDELILNADDRENLIEGYAKMNDTCLVIELISSLQLSSRQIRLLENQIKQ